MSLGRDWGFDSLSRAELLLRVERAFSVTLPTQLLQQAETLRDILAALDRAATPREAVSARFEPISRTQAEPAPAEAAILTEVLDWHVSKHGNRTHVVLAQGDGQDVALSYEALAWRSRAVAGGLRQRGVETGDRVAIMLPTSLEFFLAFFGALYACAVPTPIYPPVRPSQLAEHLTRQAGILRNAGAKLLVTAPEAAGLATLLRLQVETLQGVSTVNELASDVGALPQPAQPGDIALIQYTSGSTGDPKGSNCIARQHSGEYPRDRRSDASQPLRRFRQLAALVPRHGPHRRLARQPLFRRAIRHHVSGSVFGETGAMVMDDLSAPGHAVRRPQFRVRAMPPKD